LAGILYLALPLGMGLRSSTGIAVNPKGRFAYFMALN
jgi:hypothetical protein